ncbi:zwei Ig domain protein zig-4 [Nephila pilipes]|uniref:Zwei Ig domain protein zig-4 n=1 Tax=Nephila pilipes TaxID=299642 RepID=A0A8X6PN43_NEPPI|nr:zwei Ig domain protein zig-4 [Nephila pilipes]
MAIGQWAVLGEESLLITNSPPRSAEDTSRNMELTMLMSILFVIPLCLGRVMVGQPSQELGKNKVYLHNKDASKRTLQPTLNIRNAPPEFLDVNAGESKFLECEAGGTPPPAIHWLKDGQKVSQNLYENMHASAKDSEVVESTLGLGFTRSRLFLDCATPSDAGRYTCVAENDYIRAFKTSQVFVADTLEVDNDALCLAKKTFGSPARVHMWTHTRLEIMGSDVQLFCRPRGDPRPHVMWKGPDDKPLNDPKKYELLPNGDMIVKHIMWTDMGGYTCQAKNSEGTDEALVFLYPTMPDGDSDI